MIKRENNISKKIAFLLFLIFFFVGILTFKDYGISVDEEFHRRSGFYWLNHLLSFTFFEELNNSVALKLENIIGFTLPTVKNNPFYEDIILKNYETKGLEFQKFLIQNNLSSNMWVIAQIKK